MKQFRLEEKEKNPMIHCVRKISGKLRIFIRTKVLRIKDSKNLILIKFKIACNYNQIEANHTYITLSHPL